MNIAELYLSSPKKYEIYGATYDSQYKDRITRIDKILKRSPDSPALLFGVSVSFEEREEEGYGTVMHTLPGSLKALPIKGGNIHYNGSEDSVSVSFWLPDNHDELTLVSASFSLNGDVYTKDTVTAFKGFVASPDFDVYKN